MAALRDQTLFPGRECLLSPSDTGKASGKYKYLCVCSFVTAKKKKKKIPAVCRSQTVPKNTVGQVRTRWKKSLTVVGQVLRRVQESQRDQDVENPVYS